MIIGSADGLQFEWLPSEVEHPANPHGYGWLRASLRGVDVWHEHEESGARCGVWWEWAELLEHLTGAWPWLMYEEMYPFGLTAQHPGCMWDRAYARLTEGQATIPDPEHDALVRFQNRHDLAAGVDDAGLPSLLVLREGLNCWVACPDLNLVAQQRFAEVRDTLSALGDALWEALAGSSKGDALVDAWRRRGAAAQERAIALRTGLDASELSQLQGEVSATEFWELPSGGEVDDSELQAAARMTARVVDRAVVAQLIESVREIPSASTDALDAMGKRLLEALGNDFPMREPHVQGHDLATAFRAELGLASDAPFPDLEDWLEGQGVILRDIHLDADGALDALACWGPKHGPAVLLNVAPDSRASAGGSRRATLAHELAHLLVDRDGSLPMAEALGGNAPLTPERRANAFAAELLLPRTAAVAVLRNANLDEAVRTLTRQYVVSLQLAANQILNAPGFDFVVSDPDEQAKLHRMAGRHRQWRFSFGAGPGLGAGGAGGH